MFFFFTIFRNVLPTTASFGDVSGSVGLDNCSGKWCVSYMTLTIIPTACLLTEEPVDLVYTLYAADREQDIQANLTIESDHCVQDMGELIADGSLGL